jgi:hypothetical protein
MGLPSVLASAGRPKELRLSYAAAKGRGVGRGGSRGGAAAGGRGRGAGGGRGRCSKMAAIGKLSPCGPSLYELS